MHDPNNQSNDFDGSAMPVGDVSDDRHPDTGVYADEANNADAADPVLDPVYGNADLLQDELPDCVELFHRSKFSAQINLNKFTLVSDAEKELAIQMRPSTSFLRDGMRKFRKNKLAMASGIVLILLLLLIIIAPMVVPYSYDEIIKVNGKRDRTTKNLPPLQYSEMEQKALDEGESIFPHIFGTDELGRDYFIRVIYGTRVSIAVGMFASVIVLLIGLLYGSLSGYLGGRVDLIMMRIVDIIYSLPDLLLVILLSVVLDQTLTPKIQGTALGKLGPNMISLFIVFALLYWVGMARLVRGQILSIKQNEYVLAARSMGASTGRIIRRHILPNCISVIIISTALQVPSAIFTESYLSFMGLGVSSPMTSLGSLANEARQAIQSYPYKLLFPALMICLIVLSFNLFGDGLRDAFDPKLRK